MTVKASPSRCCSAAKRRSGEMQSPLNRSPSTHRPSSRARLLTAVISPSPNGIERPPHGTANGSDGWLSTGAATAGLIAAASANPPVKHIPMTPTPGRDASSS